MAEKISTIQLGLIIMGVVACVGIIAFMLIRSKETVVLQPSTTKVQETVHLKPLGSEDTVLLSEINDNIERQLPVGEVTDEFVSVTDAIYEVWDEKENGLNWSSFTLSNNGPSPVYVCVNKWRQPLAPIAVGRSMSVDLKQRGAIKKIFLKCDAGGNANVTMHAIK